MVTATASAVAAALVCCAAPPATALSFHTARLPPSSLFGPTTRRLAVPSPRLPRAGAPVTPRRAVALSAKAEPVLVLDDDTLVTTPTHVALLVAVWLISIWALAPVAAAAAVGGVWGAVQLTTALTGAVFFSDFFSGIFHWGADNYGDGDTPIFGSVIVAFQGHHANPWTITHRGFFNNVHKIAKGVIPLMLLSLLVTPSPAARLFAVVFFNCQILSQEFHKLSHTVKPPPLVTWLQEKGVILSRKEHGLHHSSPFESNYCILTGTCNSFLDKTHFWRRLEAAVYRYNGSEPNCWKEDPALREFSLRL